MKLVASALVAASLAFTSTVTSLVWTSTPAHQACAHERQNWLGIGVGAYVCTEKFFTLTDEMVFADDVAGACARASPGAYPWCPLSEAESVIVYTNLAMMDYTTDQGHFQTNRWVAEGISSWTGIQLLPLVPVSPFVKLDYHCPWNLKSPIGGYHAGGIEYRWNPNKLDGSIFNNEKMYDANKDGVKIIDQRRRCVAMGERLQFKWGNMHCGPWMSPLKIIKVPEAQKRRAVCVTTADKSSEAGYAPMDMEAPKKLQNELVKMVNALKMAALFFGLFMFFIFTGCCFCCCFCCCCKPCKGGDKNTPAVTQTTQVQQQAAPAPAPAMPGYAPPMPQAPAYNPYAQPQQQPMGGINMNISNNNTNTN